MAKKKPDAVVFSYDLNTGKFLKTEFNGKTAGSDAYCFKQEMLKDWPATGSWFSPKAKKQFGEWNMKRLGFTKQ